MNRFGFYNPLNVYWQQVVSIAAHHKPSILHLHGTTRGKGIIKCKLFMSKVERTVKCYRFEDLYTVGIKLTRVSHEVSFSFLTLASALCLSSSACFAAVAASMSLIFKL